MSQTVLKVEGMSCNHCKMAVEKALKAVSGVESAEVNLDKKEVVVNGTADQDQMAKAIEDAGYTVVK